MEGTNKREVGGYYEGYAAACLQKRGYRIIERNYWCRVGEIDLIGEQDGYLCFIEVKYRSVMSGGCPQEAVNGRKQQRICRAAAWYLRERGYPAQIKCRFDVVGIIPQGIWLIKNAFGGM